MLVQRKGARSSLLFQERHLQHSLRLRARAHQRRMLWCLGKVGGFCPDSMQYEGEEPQVGCEEEEQGTEAVASSGGLARVAFRRIFLVWT